MKAVRLGARSIRRKLWEPAVPGGLDNVVGCSKSITKVGRLGDRGIWATASGYANGACEMSHGYRQVTPKCLRRIRVPRRQRGTYDRLVFDKYGRLPLCYTGQGKRQNRTWITSVSLWRTGGNDAMMTVMCIGMNSVRMRLRRINARVRSGVSLGGYVNGLRRLPQVMSRSQFKDHKPDQQGILGTTGMNRPGHLTAAPSFFACHSENQVGQHSGHQTAPKRAAYYLFNTVAAPFCAW